MGYSATAKAYDEIWHLNNNKFLFIRFLASIGSQKNTGLSFLCVALPVVITAFLITAI